jgi:Xaa-Pro dipeptidase
VKQEIRASRVEADVERLSRVRSALAEARLDALVCRLPENVLLLSGHWPLIGLSFLLFPREGCPVLVVPHCDEEDAVAEAWEAKIEPFLYGVLDASPPFESIASGLHKAVGADLFARVGFEGGFEATAPAWNAAENAVPAATSYGVLREVFGANALFDATELLERQRACKTAREAAGIRRANVVAALGLKTFRESVATGTDGVSLAADVERNLTVEAMHTVDVRRVRAFAQVATGPQETARSFRPMERMTTRSMATGDIALLELAVVADGFWADRSRVRVAGQCSEQQNALFEVVCKAQDAAIAAIRPGATAGEVDAAARNILKTAGLGEYFIHVTGHGLGLRYHEPNPLLLPGSEELIQKGMTVTVEPGVYIDGFGGMRVEENVLVTDTGAEVLGPATRDLA